MSKSVKIDGELIQSSGFKIRKVGYLIVWMVVVYTVYLLVVISSTDEDIIELIGFITYVTLIVMSILVIVNIIRGGSDLVNSVVIELKDGPYEDYYPNGKIKSKGIILNGQKTGIWTYYNQYGDLLSRKEFNNGVPIIPNKQSTD